MNLDNMPGTEGFGGFGGGEEESTDDVVDDGGEQAGLSGTGGVGNLRTQGGFLSGFNRAAGTHTLGPSKTNKKNTTTIY